MLGFIALFAMAISCDDLKNPPPTAPEVPPPPPSQYKIEGHWEADSSQGRRIAFDVDDQGKVVNGRINLHHDCNTGRWRTTLDGFEAQIVDDVFITTNNWSNYEGGINRKGTVTISGRFEGNRLVHGGFINSVNDSRFEDQQPTGEVCPTVQATFEGTRGQ